MKTFSLKGFFPSVTNTDSFSMLSVSLFCVYVSLRLEIWNESSNFNIWGATVNVTFLQLQNCFNVWKKLGVPYVIKILHTEAPWHIVQCTFHQFMNERNHFKCFICHYKCSWKGNLMTQHITLVHEGKNEFKRSICCYKCSQKKSLMRLIELA